MTPRQLQTLKFVRDRLNRTGIFPSLGQVAKALGNSRPCALDLLRALTRKGYLAGEGRKRMLGPRKPPRVRGMTAWPVMGEIGE